MDANQDSIGTRPDSNRTCPDTKMEAYAGWCEERAAEAIATGNVFAEHNLKHNLAVDHQCNMAANWLTAANLARGVYTGEGVFA